MIKNLLLSVVLALPMVVNASEKSKTCEAVAEAAKQVMTYRQLGVSDMDLMNAVIKTGNQKAIEMTLILVAEASLLPTPESADDKRAIVRDFTISKYNSCMNKPR